ncbi:MFS transporter [Viridibacillus sp. YIM B01967]|uniref:MFS transporter n=1 Tax=Viridibacillus soli TaxID=2798301 RepID=A0ABS1H9U6_9BACL|nr:MFS transporter [Viridibacillus soli]MBK3495798.1 MFS transporter [Viridibacillus soli]
MGYNTNFEKRRFWILVIIVSISGFSQGMLLPLVSVIFEQDGVSSALNGLNATGLYLGTLLVSPFIERPLRKYGYKPIIIVGGALVFLSLLMFPLWKSITFWFVLRILIGVGDNALHYATQTWITSTAPVHLLGKNIAIYGLSFGIGFAVGPLFVPLMKISEGLPFIVSSLLCLLAWSLVFFVKNEHPEAIQMTSVGDNAWGRYVKTFKYAWVAFLPPFCYGFLESSLNALFPVYALRKSFDVSMVSIILAAFSTGGILSQVPLGMLGDKIGRRKVSLLALAGGGTIFGIASFFEGSEIVVAIAFLCAGVFAGSVFSLGIAYMTDLTPKELLPTGNLLCGIFFSFGSLSGPFFGGIYLQLVDQYSFLLLVSAILLIVFFVSLIGGKTVKHAV